MLFGQFKKFMKKRKQKKKQKEEEEKVGRPIGPWEFCKFVLYFHVTGAS